MRSEEKQKIFIRGKLKAWIDWRGARRSAIVFEKTVTVKYSDGAVLKIRPRCDCVPLTQRTKNLTEVQR